MVHLLPQVTHKRKSLPQPPGSPLNIFSKNFTVPAELFSSPGCLTNQVIEIVPAMGAGKLA